MTFAVGLMIGSGFLHALWNLFTKKSQHKSTFLWLAQFVAVSVFFPFMVWEWFHEPFHRRGVPWVVASMFLHGFYVWLLSKAYTWTDLSVVYPIMRGTAPVIVPLVGIFIWGETLTMTGWVGLLIILLGITLLSEFGKSAQGAPPKWSGLGLAFIIGILISAYTLVDRQALHDIPPITLNMAGNLGNMLFLTTLVLKSKQIRSEWTLNKKTIVFVGVISFGGYLLYLWAMPHLPISTLTPMREIGTVFAAIFGMWILKERSGIRRILASILITVGVIIIGIQAGA